MTTWYKRAKEERAMKLMEELPAFAPSSAGNRQERARLTLQSARQTFPLLAQLLSEVGVERRPRPIETFADSESARAAADRLGALFEKHGSDKSNVNNYHILYAAILRDPSVAVDLLEIGLGTNNKDVVSHMGPSGVPGASLRAFKEYLPQARIYGADVDQRILFTEERIKTLFVDQTDPETFAGLQRNLGHPLDLIIDDGLHAPNANIATLLFALRNLKPDGWLVIEDIAAAALPVWDVVVALLSPKYPCELISSKAAFIFVLRKSDPSSALET
jgi:hypothetical protein